MAKTKKPDVEIVEVEEREVSVPVALVSSAEIDSQIATARRYPRSIRAFHTKATEMATLTEETAGECVYALPRDGKTIQGPSARLAEILVSAWGNCRASARIVEEGAEFVVAQGMFHDLESNSAIGYEVRRRIVDKHGRRFKPDMIGVTANAACSIALRNAVLKGVPKAIWNDVYRSAVKTIAGDERTFKQRRAAALAKFDSLGVKKAELYKTLSIKGEADLTTEHLVTLFGMLTALDNGDSTVEQMFGKEEAVAPAGSRLDALQQKAAIAQPKTTRAIPEPPEAEGEGFSKELTWVLKEIAAASTEAGAAEAIEEAKARFGEDFTKSDRDAAHDAIALKFMGAK